MTNDKYSTFNPDVTLQELAQMYEELFARKIYQIDIGHKSSPLRIKFDEGNLKHMLGLQHIIQSNDKPYRAENLYRSMLDGSFTMEMLEELDAQKSKKWMMRIQCFQLLPELLKEGKCGLGTSKGSMRDIEFFFFDQTLGHYIYFGVRKEKNSDFYAPVTFFENKSTYPKHASGKLVSVNGHTIIEQNTEMEK
ncbi:PBECR4 domain-containing protein [Exiguobacterium sp. s168]|uniref:PBECR4 domain-containing protein n=1 Tax=Exiguobacterium sp. s168 TaxID=2751194 RepID=UPI001BE6A95A|nr:PBECR4 domain-containing protein [Exiguobacterium sp. s168]